MYYPYQDAKPSRTKYIPLVVYKVMKGVAWSLEYNGDSAVLAFLVEAKTVETFWQWKIILPRQKWLSFNRNMLLYITKKHGQAISVKPLVGSNFTLWEYNIIIIH